MARKKPPLQSVVREDLTPTGIHGIMREDLVNPEIVNPGSRVREIIPVLTCYFIGAILLFGISDISDRATQVGEVGARAWPTGLGWAIVLLGSIILAIAVVKFKTPMEHPDRITHSGMIKFILTMSLIFGYALTFRAVPFWASTLVTIVLLLIVYEIRNLKSVAIFAGIMTLTLQLLFINLLRVPL